MWSLIGIKNSPVACNSLRKKKMSNDTTVSLCPRGRKTLFDTSKAKKKDKDRATYEPNNPLTEPRVGNQSVDDREGRYRTNASESEEEGENEEVRMRKTKHRRYRLLGSKHYITLS